MTQMSPKLGFTLCLSGYQWVGSLSFYDSDVYFVDGFDKWDLKQGILNGDMGGSLRGI